MSENIQKFKNFIDVSHFDTLTLHLEEVSINYYFY